MMRFLFVLILAALGATPASARGRERLAGMPIVVGAQPTLAEQMAATELVDHLARITGVKPAVVTNPPAGPAIYLGDTAFARARGIDVAGLGPEESLLRTVGSNLIVTGGRPRGTLYGVYAFLEGELGCRWYTPWIDRVPAQPDCRVPVVDRRVQPAFRLRDDCANLPDRDWTDAQKQARVRFLARNRVNGPQGWRDVWWGWQKPPFVPEVVPGGMLYGGGEGLKYGAPHMFAHDFPADEYFETHPEWFSMRAGQRVRSAVNNGNHLCLTNQALRDAYVAKLKERMRAHPDLHVYAVAMNDGGNRTSCDCPECTAFATASSWSDLYFDFINELARRTADEFPENRIWTLAYSFASDPPRKVRIADNVIVQCCLLTSGRVTSPEATATADFVLPELAEWAGKGGEIQAWDYLDVGPPYPFLLPMYFRMAAQYRYAHDLGLTGVFGENRPGRILQILPEFFAMRDWLFAQLLQDPDQDVMALVGDFMDGCYGPAGRYLTAYVDMQRERLDQWPHRMVDLDFVDRTQALWDQAETAVAADPVLRQRVREARIWPDLTALFFRNKLAAEWVNSRGNDPATYPYPATLLRPRLLARLATVRSPYWLARYPVPYPKGPRQTLAECTAGFVDRIAVGRDYAPLPAIFRSLPADAVVDVPGYQLNRSKSRNGTAELVEDSTSAFGLAAARLTADELPLTTGVYDAGKKSEILTRKIAAEDIPGPGYHVYYVGRTTIPIQSRFWFTNSWLINQELGVFHDATAMDRQWDMYVCVRFVGAAYPYGLATEPNGVYLDRVVLVPADSHNQVMEEAL